MISWKLVSEVARTSHPSITAGWTLTVETIVRRTTGTDWTGEWLIEKDGEFVPDPLEKNWVADYCMLRKDAARRVAQELNRERPWDVARAMRAIAAARKPLEIENGDALVGQIVGIDN